MREIRILIPPGKQLKSHSYSLELRSMARHSPLALRHDIAFTGDFPAKALSEPMVQQQRGCSWLSFTYAPVQYRHLEEELLLVQHLELEVEWEASGQPVESCRLDPGQRSRLKKRLLDPENLDRYYGQLQHPRAKSAEAAVEYLLVTNEELKEYFAPLLEWKHRKGVKVKLITVEEILESYPDSTDQLKLKRCFEEHYDHHGLRWVLLGGDETVVPVQGCYASSNMHLQSITDYDIPTDLFYACFDNRFDWNSLVDEKVGELYIDGHDLYPEIDITRIPVHSPEQVEAFVRKVLIYEKGMKATGVTDRMLLSGVLGWSSWDGRSDSHHRSEFAYWGYIAPYYQGEKYSFYDTGSDFPGRADYQLNVENLVEQLNSSYGYFQFTGHGNPQVMAMETGRSFHSADALALKNEYPGIVLSNCCYANAYDSVDASVSEAFMWNPDGGAVAFIGSTRFGFGNPDKGDMRLGPSLQYNSSFAKEFLSDNGNGLDWKHFGSVAYRAKGDHFLPGGAYSYLHYAINPLGDPEMPLHRGALSHFEQVRIYRMGNEITVNTGGMPACRISLTYEDLDPGRQEVVEGTSVHTFKNVDEAFRLVITAPGYLPYEYASDHSVGMNESLVQALNVYPNPVTDRLRVNWGLEESMLRVYDISGRLHLESFLLPGSNDLIVEGLPPGIYMLRVAYKGQQVQKRIIKL